MSSVCIEVGDIVVNVSGSYLLEYENGKLKLSSGTEPEVVIKKQNPISDLPAETVNTKPYYDTAKLRSGSHAFYGLVEIWKKNFGLENTEQPNRIKALQQAMSISGDEILMYLKKSEGLTNGILELFPPLPDADELQIIDHSKFYRTIACNMAQVSSVSMPELCQYLEPHANYLEQRFWW